MRPFDCRILLRADPARAGAHSGGIFDESLDWTGAPPGGLFLAVSFPSHLSCVVGETVANHIPRLRLERAAQRLKSGERPVTASHSEAGYERTKPSLARFERASGASPSGFRESRPESSPLEPIAVKVRKNFGDARRLRAPRRTVSRMWARRGAA